MNFMKLGRKKSLFKNQEGFSLLEVVLAIAILGIVFIPLMNYFTDAIKYNQMSKTKQKATLLAQKVMEEVKKEEGAKGVFENYIPSPGGTNWVRDWSNDVSNYNALLLLPAVPPDAFPSPCDYLAEMTMDGIKYDVKVTVEADKEERPELVPIRMQKDFVAIESDITTAGAISSDAASRCAEKLWYDHTMSVAAGTIIPGLKRTMHLGVTSSAPGMKRVYAYYTYQYTISGITVAAGPYNIQDSEVLESELQNIYLFYYDEKYNGGTIDKLVLSGMNDFFSVSGRRLYLICQNREWVMGDGVAPGHNTGFRLSVEGLPSTLANRAKRIYSNMTWRDLSHLGEEVLPSASSVNNSKEVVKQSRISVSVYSHRDAPDQFKDSDRLIQIDSVKGE